MSAWTIDWCMFGLGVLGILGVVWLRRVRSSAQGSGRGLGVRALGRFAVFAAGVTALEGLFQFSGTDGWGSMTVGFIVGGMCGALAGRRWIIRHPSGEASVQLRGLSRWLASWRFQAVLFASLLVISMVPPFAPISALVSSRTNLQAAMQGWLAGLFLVFGLSLGLSPRDK